MADYKASRNDSVLVGAMTNRPISFSVTGCRKAPDIGFTASACGTAELAYARALSFLAGGLRLVQVRDPDGRVYSSDNLHLLQSPT